MPPASTAFPVPFLSMSRAPLVSVRASSRHVYGTDRAQRGDGPPASGDPVYGRGEVGSWWRVNDVLAEGVLQ